jgi:ribosomal protein S18 acetylase RimI-like enzyme
VSDAVSAHGVRPMTQEDVSAIVDVHRRAFSGFFLTFLGPKFLRELYRGILTDPSGMAFVYADGGRVTGFVAGTGRPGGLYRRLMRERWWRFGIAAVGAILRRPTIIPRLLRAFGKPAEEEAHAGGALLMSLAVDPRAEGRQVGSTLLEAFKQAAQERGATAVVLTTDRDDNDRANAFYQARRFRLARSFVTPEGRAMNEYICDLS